MGKRADECGGRCAGRGAQVAPRVSDLSRGSAAIKQVPLCRGRSEIVDPADTYFVFTTRTRDVTDRDRFNFSCDRRPDSSDNIDAIALGYGVYYSKTVGRRSGGVRDSDTRYPH